MEPRDTWSEDLKDILEDSFKPIVAFTQILEGVDGQFVPGEGHPALCARVLDVLLLNQKRVMDEAFEIIDRKVGSISVTRYTYAEENEKEGVAGKFCDARLIGNERAQAS
jgi:hypothetical protein